MGFDLKKGLLAMHVAYGVSPTLDMTSSERRQESRVEVGWLRTAAEGREGKSCGD